MGEIKHMNNKIISKKNRWYIKKLLTKTINIKNRKLLKNINITENSLNKTELWQTKFERNYEVQKAPKGIRFYISGRINGVMKKRVIRRNMGRTWAQKYSERGEYKQETIRTKWGIFGLSIWLRRKEETNKKLLKSKNVIERVRKLNKII